MIDKLTEFLEKRQEQILDEKTDMYNKFRSSADEAFYKGYVECMKDRYDFLKDKERNNQND